jgi:hypothetical protein
VRRSLNYPLGPLAIRTCDDDWFYTLSREWADYRSPSFPLRDYWIFSTRGLRESYNWYSIFGGRQDYVTYNLHGREITVELDEDYITPVAELDDLWEYNYRSMLDILKTHFTA